MFKLRIDSHAVSSTTGLMTVNCRITEARVDGSMDEGIPEVWGISGIELSQAFGGEVERWLRERVAPVMLERHQSRIHALSALTDLTGKSIDLG